MSLEYIRKTYGVPARRGQRVRYAPEGCKPREGVIVGSRGAHLRICIGEDKRPGRYHPTWAIEYLDR